MKKRYIVGALALAGGYWLIKQAISMQGDLAHYNRLRAMSGDGPLREEVPAMLQQIKENFAETSGQLHGVLGSLPADAARYARIKAM
ncbi:MAG: hypothetical protein M3R35_09130 [Candidatus Eremiobacteraeota bacterium]|nr:hypothetical protein [Candidatus Eremiobacteraeota bacterium]